MGQLTKRLAALAFLLLLAFPGAALADGKHRHSNHHGPNYHKHGAHHQQQHRYGAVRAYPYRYPHKPGRFHAAPLYAQDYVLQGYGCHAVTGIDYHLGRRAKVGGTLCYDAYGRAFILPGSRYVIGFLY